MKCDYTSSESYSTAPFNQHNLKLLLNKDSVHYPSHPGDSTGCCIFCGQNVVNFQPYYMSKSPRLDASNRKGSFLDRAIKARLIN